MTIQKFSVSSKEFPLIFSNGSYYVRYKIVTDNKMISSDSSGVYKISINDTSVATTANFILSGQELTLNITPTYDSVGMLVKWDGIKNASFSNIKYDVYLNWSYDNSGSTYDGWEYAGEYSSAECYVTIPTKNNQKAYYLKAKVQIATYDKIISSNVLLVESSTGVSTTYVASTGNIDGGVI
jgi:hypothetical protein